MNAPAAVSPGFPAVLVIALGLLLAGCSDPAATEPGSAESVSAAARASAAGGAADEPAVADGVADGAALALLASRSSMARLERLLEETGATLWIQHELAFHEDLAHAPRYHE